MFTGIIEELGQIISINKDEKFCENGAVLKIGAKKILEDCRIGDSISVNGVCLTVNSFGNSFFCVDVMPETFRKSNLGDLVKGENVNLERAVKAEGRFGGHFVSGHIDGTGTICKVQNEGNAVWIFIQTEYEILKFIVLKGSIAIDGITLTVASVFENGFAVSVIPHTAEETTLLGKKTGERVNLENDVIGKYVARFLGFSVEEDFQKKKESQEKRNQMFMEFLKN